MRTIDADIRIEKVRDQLFPVTALTILPICLLILGAILNLIPSGLWMTLLTLSASFTAAVSCFVVGLYFSIRTDLQPREHQRFLNLFWGSLFLALLFRMVGLALLLLIPTIFNLQAAMIFRSLKRT